MKIKDNNKITLTFGQLKKLVNETRDPRRRDWSKFSNSEADEEANIMETLDQVYMLLDKLLNNAQYASMAFQRDVGKAIDLIEKAKDDYLDI